jgi:Na+/H+ antiporter NhaA|eukprot:COSAG01_NODE_16016_length_1278_cov_1.611535_1_plen_61_part_00
MHGFEHGLKRFMVFVVLFCFTTANAGVKINEAPGPLAFTIWLSLFLGKFGGIVLMAVSSS